MRMLSVEQTNTFSLRILVGFIGAISALVGAPALAKTAPTKANAAAFSPMKKAAMLNFPNLPKEILDRAAGNKPRTSSVTKTDNNLSRDWALVNIGFFDVFSPLVQPTKIEACNNSIVVAVVDTGIDYTHPELKENIWVNKGETGPWSPPKGMENLTACRDKSCNGIDDDGDGFIDDVVGWDFVNDVPLPYDVHGHGTHISGIISSAPANSVGLVGVCPKVTIMPLKYYDNSGIGYNNLQNTVRAIEYAVKMGADIINYSGGGSDPAPAEKAAIEKARAKGILFVAAAGNDGHNNDQIPYYPASYPLDNIISVASINRDNQLLPSSNFGKTVHVGAPGLSIVSALPGGRFGTMSGTSQATAFVTGEAALLASQYKDKKDIDYHKIKSFILGGVRPMKGNEKKTVLSSGLISLGKAVQLSKDDTSRKGPPPGQDLALRPQGGRTGSSAQ